MVIPPQPVESSTPTTTKIIDYDFTALSLVANHSQDTTSTNFTYGYWDSYDKQFTTGWTYESHGTGVSGWNWVSAGMRWEGIEQDPGFRQTSVGMGAAGSNSSRYRDYYNLNTTLVDGFNNMWFCAPVNSNNATGYCHASHWYIWSSTLSFIWKKRRWTNVMSYSQTEGYRTYKNMNDRQVRDVSELYNVGDEGLEPREMRSTSSEKQYLKEKRIMKYDQRERRWKLTLLGLGFVGFLILAGALFYNRKSNVTTPTTTQIPATTPPPTTVTTPERTQPLLKPTVEQIKTETEAPPDIEIPWMRETWEQESYAEEPQISEEFVTQYGSTGTGGFLDFQNEIGSESTGGFFDIRESKEYQEATSEPAWWEREEFQPEYESRHDAFFYDEQPKPSEVEEQESIMSGITFSPKTTKTTTTTENPNAAVLPWLRVVRRRKKR